MPLLAVESQLTQTHWALGRSQDLTQAWQWGLVAVVMTALIGFSLRLYARDAHELRWWRAALLMGLRTLAWLGVLAYYLAPQWQTIQQTIQPSRAVLLIDTSVSMDLHDSPTASTSAQSRLEQIIAGLDRGGMLEQLRKTHDVALYHFDTELSKPLTLTRLADHQAEGAEAEPDLTWTQSLVPQGTETRLSEALQQAVQQERTEPLSGVIVCSDGVQTSGVELDTVLPHVVQTKVPVHVIGLGSDKLPANVRISDLQAPSRAFVGTDKFGIVAYIQAEQLVGRSVAIEFRARRADQANKEGEAVLESRPVVLGAAGELIPVRFEVTPTEAGRFLYRVAVAAPAEDQSNADDTAETEIEVVDHKTKVLLFASGPSREYLFVRNLFRRDASMQVDVLLQTASHLSPISQDAHQVLDEFPTTLEALDQYDALVAFDPDWRLLSTEQLDLLENWVGQRSGGLIAIAGPVEMDHWVQDARLTKLRNLYPVEFSRRFTALEDSHYGAAQSWAVALTREGLGAEFLRLADEAAASETIWQEFPGVFGFYEAKRAKSGATVYAQFANPDASYSGELPVYMAGQFYGAGRVFYLGSGEMWRLRGTDEAYFERFYTQLVRHVSQGRLLLHSGHSLLLTDQEHYTQGSTVAVQAVVTDSQYQPLKVDSLQVQMVRPNGQAAALTLFPQNERPGSYAAQFTALQEGTYHLELPGEGTAEPVVQRISVRQPRLERDHPQRNEILLSGLASATGGTYYRGMAAALGQETQPALTTLLKDRTRTAELPPVKDETFDRQWNQAVILFVCGVLSLEWLIRRLSRLA